MLQVSTHGERTCANLDSGNRVVRARGTGKVLDVTAGAIATFFIIALVDSINPSALVVTLQLLSRRAPLRAILTYIAAVFATYLTFSIMLVLGLTALIDPLGAFFETRAANIGLAVLGAGLLAYALFSRNPKNPPKPRPFKLTSTSVSGLILLGVSVTVMELPTALPLLGAVGLLTSADPGSAVWLPLIILYNVVFVLPPLLLTFGYRWLGERGGEKLQQSLSRGARETMLWVFGIIGFYLLMQALEALGVFGDAVSIGIG